MRPAVDTVTRFQMSNNEPVYRPAADSGLLADAAVELCEPTDTVLEVGIGRGLAATTVTQEVGATVIGTDVNRKAVEHAHKAGIHTVQTDIVAAIQSEQADVVMFNAPYLPVEPTTPPRLALEGDTGGHALIARFLRRVTRVLSEDGDVLVVASSKTPLEAVTATLDELQYNYTRMQTAHVFFEDIVVFHCWLTN